jgi:hypothetical protein
MPVSVNAPVTRNDWAKEALWSIPAVMPLLLILACYLVSSWSWGLMDDLQLLREPGGIWQRTVSIFQIYLAFGELKWTHALHCAVFYQIFAGFPKAFYVFKCLEISLMLLMWGALAWRLTGQRIAVWLVAGIALSFHYLYDQFFFLSTHETTGLLFLGLGVWLIVSVEFGVGISGVKRVAGWTAAVVALLLALGAKETFLAGVFSTGAACLWMGRRDRRARMLWAGILIVLFSAAFGILLKFGVSKSYTSAYSFTNWARISSNCGDWLRKDFANHLPWVLGTGALFGLIRARLSTEDRTGPAAFGLVLGGTLYLSFLGLILPWNASSYYAGPLGVFFAFFLAVLCSKRLGALSTRLTVVVVLAALLLNTTVCLYALRREWTYNLNTQAVWALIRKDGDFVDTARSGRVYTNAMEPGAAIPGHANRWWGLGLKNFTVVRSAAGIPDGKAYLVYSPRFGEWDAAEFRTWEPVQAGKYWTVYRKGY